MSGWKGQLQYEGGFPKKSCCDGKQHATEDEADKCAQAEQRHLNRTFVAGATVGLRVRQATAEDREKYGIPEVSRGTSR